MAGNNLTAALAAEYEQLFATAVIRPERATAVAAAADTIRANMARLPKARVVTAEQARANPTLVVPGMVFYIDTGGGTGHAGFVSDVVNGRLSTVEGNTTLGEGSREGIGVFARSGRRIDQINLGFVELGCPSAESACLADVGTAHSRSTTKTAKRHNR